MIGVQLFLLPSIIRNIVATKGQNIFFAESSHVAYGTQSTMQTHILSLHIPWTPVVGSKGQNIFTESRHVAYLFKGYGT